MGVTAGAALNNAILLAAHGKIKMSEIEEKALGIAKLSIDLKAKVGKLLEGGKEEKPVAKPQVQPQPAQQDQPPHPVNDFDDIPF